MTEYKNSFDALRNILMKEDENVYARILCNVVSGYYLYNSEQTIIYNDTTYRYYDFMTYDSLKDYTLKQLRDIAYLVYSLHTAKNALKKLKFIIKYFNSQLKPIHAFN